MRSNAPKRKDKGKSNDNSEMTSLTAHGQLRTTAGEFQVHKPFESVYVGNVFQPFSSTLNSSSASLWLCCRCSCAMWPPEAPSSCALRSCLTSPLHSKLAAAMPCGSSLQTHLPRRHASSWSQSRFQRCIFFTTVLISFKRPSPQVKGLGELKKIVQDSELCATDVTVRHFDQVRLAALRNAKKNSKLPTKELP